jgi:aspartyl-tRNA(Asn)/glutamyl-tRNA(Gln) amidotransferase subunit C
MSQFTKEDAAKVAKLARIRLTDDEAERYAGEIVQVLDWVEQLQEVNTDDVPQMASASDVSLPWRADRVTDGSIQQEVVANAPEQEYGCYVVPKVVE